jgi:hypothetical protein
MWFAGSTAQFYAGVGYMLQSTDGRTFAPVPRPIPRAVPVYSPLDKGTEAFDADYAGPSSVAPAADGHELLMIYHGENHFFHGQDDRGFPFYATIGLAQSSDDGQTWTRVGPIITGNEPKPEISPGPSGSGAGNPSVIAAGGYYYCVYEEEASPNSGYQRGLGLARSPIASGALPGSWKKYYDGSFSSDAANNGPFTDISNPVVERSGWQQFPNVSYNTYIHAFVMLVTGNDGIYMLTSEDLVHWNDPRLIVSADPANRTVAHTMRQRPSYAWYPTMVSPDQPSSEITDRTGYVYVEYSPGNVRSSMYRYPFHIGNP